MSWYYCQYLVRLWSKVWFIGLFCFTWLQWTTINSTNFVINTILLKNLLIIVDFVYLYYYYYLNIRGELGISQAASLSELCTELYRPVTRFPPAGPTPKTIPHVLGEAIPGSGSDPNVKDECRSSCSCTYYHSPSLIIISSRSHSSLTPQSF